MTLFEYKAVRQTGRDPTWNVLRVSSEKNVFSFNTAFADYKCIPEVYEPNNLSLNPEKLFGKRRTILYSSYDSAGRRLEVIVQIRSARIIRQSSLSK